MRQYNWMRGSRRLNTYVYYPAIGTPGGSPITNAPVAAGVFPIYNFTHGLNSRPQGCLALIRPLAAAGFIVPAPYFQHMFSDVNNGYTSRDVSEILTQILALNDGSDPLAGHIDTAAGVGVSGHSLGALVTHGLLTSWPDNRIRSAAALSCIDTGNPSSTVKAKVLFVHGDRDPTTSYSSARQAYSEFTAPKAFLTFLGGSHTSYWSTSRFPTTVVDWARWSMYGDLAARDRLAADATSSTARYEFVPGPTEPPPPTLPTYNVVDQHSGKVAEINAASTTAGAVLVQRTANGRQNQQFEFIDAGGGYLRIKPATAARSCSGGSNQKWTQQ